MLKGAMLLTTWFADPHRPTRDVDFLGFGDPAPDAMLAVFREVCAVIEDDGVTFDPDALRVDRIRDALEYGGLRLRTLATVAGADLFETHTGSMRRPHSGSMVHRRTLTAAMIDSRDFLAARRRADTEVMLPAGPKVAFTGALDCNDHEAIWTALDKVHAKHPGMVLLHGGSPKGAERIAACWADNRKVPQVAFKPDWAKHQKAAPFKRHDALLEVMPIGVVVFPGTGIQDNLADKARKLGVPLFDFRKGGA